MSNLTSVAVKHEPMKESEIKKGDGKSRPEMHVSGKHADLMGAGGLKTGDRVRQTIEYIVEDHTKRESNGKAPEFSFRLCVDKVGEPEVVASDESYEEEDEDDEKGESDAGLSYIERMASGNA